MNPITKGEGLLLTIIFILSCLYVYEVAKDGTMTFIGINETLEDYENNNTQMAGFYNNAGYFCVATKGRTSIEIAETTMHELAHYYVDSDEDHFVKEWQER